jgi:hypothetical protein
MASKSLFESNPILTLGAIVVLAVAADAVAAHRSSGGSGRGAGGGGGYYGSGLGSGRDASRSSARVRSGAFISHPDAKVRSGRVNAPVNDAPVNAPVSVRENVHRGVGLHRQVAHRRVVHSGVPVDWYDDCHLWRRVATPFGWTPRRVNICSRYYGQYSR